MSPNDQIEQPSRLDLAATALRAIQVADMPAELLQATDRAVRDAWQARARRSRSLHVVASRRIAAACLALAIVGLAIVLWQSTAPHAFAEVAKQVGATKTLRAVIADPREGGMLFVAGSRRRFQAESAVVLADSATGTEFMLDTRNKTAYRIPRRNAAKALDFYSLFRDLAKAASTPIEAHVDATGQRYPGFAGAASLPVGGKQTWDVDANVWTDPVTKLPVRLEIRHRGENGEPAMIVEQIEFDVPLADSLFDMAIPPEYEVVGLAADQLRPPPGKAEAAQLTITPRVGIGPVKFGMTRDQIVAILGEPEFTLYDVYLNYPSKGLQLVINGPYSTLGIIIANPADAANLERNDFPGQTDKGIRIGSTRNDVLAAYGAADPPLPTDRKNGPQLARYEKLGLMFSFGEDKVVQIFAAQKN